MRLFLVTLLVVSFGWVVFNEREERVSGAEESQSDKLQAVTKDRSNRVALNKITKVAKIDSFNTEAYERALREWREFYSNNRIHVSAAAHHLQAEKTVRELGVGRELSKLVETLRSERLGTGSLFDDAVEKVFSETPSLADKFIADFQGITDRSPATPIHLWMEFAGRFSANPNVLMEVEKIPGALGRQLVFGITQKMARDEPMEAFGLLKKHLGKDMISTTMYGAIGKASMEVREDGPFVQIAEKYFSESSGIDAWDRGARDFFARWSDLSRDEAMTYLISQGSSEWNLANFQNVYHRFASSDHVLASEQLEEIQDAKLYLKGAEIVIRYLKPDEARKVVAKIEPGPERARLEKRIKQTEAQWSEESK